MLGGMRDRVETTKELTKLAKQLRELNDFRNALAHADYDLVTWIEWMAVKSDLTLTPENVTFHLHVYSSSGLPKDTNVSDAIVDKRIEDEQNLIWKLRGFANHILASGT